MMTSKKEVVRVMIAYPTMAEEKLLLPELYEAPVAELEHLERESESYVAWVIVLGFVAYALVLYWAEKCRRKGGDPEIRFSGLRGFIVKCRK